MTDDAYRVTLSLASPETGCPAPDPGRDAFVPDHLDPYPGDRNARACSRTAARAARRAAGREAVRSNLGDNGGVRPGAKEAAMPRGRSWLPAAAVTTALSLGLMAAPATALPIQEGADLLPAGGCPAADQVVPPLPGFEGVYEQRGNPALRCAIVWNTSSDRVLRMWGSGAIEGPIRISNARGWINTATAIAVQRNLGEVVLMPREFVVLSSPPPSTYFIEVADVEAFQAGKVAEALAVQALNKYTPAALLRSDMASIIKVCATAAERTWQEAKDFNNDTASLSDVLAKMWTLGPCKTAYNAIDPDYQNPAKAPWFKRMIDKAAQYDAPWFRAYKLDSLSKVAQRLSSVF